jgi:ABC-type antimicrobial peptide transport system permease subunit
MAERRFALWLFEAFSALALVLAAFGIYGLLAHDVQQRRRELGVRMAMGATRSQVARLVLSNGIRLCAAGMLLGVADAPVALRLLSSLLFGVTSTDVVSLVAAPIVLMGVAMISIAAPA